MAVSVTGSPAKGRRDVLARQIAVVRVTFDSSYPLGGTYATNGEAFDPKEHVGFTPAVVIPVIRGTDGAATSGPGRFVQYDYTNKRLHVYEDGATVAGVLDEVPNTTDLSTLVIDVICISD